MGQETDKIGEIVELIKAKAELQSLDDDFVREKIDAYILAHGKIREKFLAAQSAKQFSRSKEYDELKKSIRKVLRASYGVFDADEKDEREGILDIIDGPEDELGIRKLLTLHQSTNERLPFYTRFYERIAESIPSIKSILDIGCGMHPLSYPFLVKALGKTVRDGPQYECCDISSSDMEFLNTYFKKFSITGYAFVCDAVNKAEELIGHAAKANPEVIIMLKLLDTLESIKRHHTKWLLPELAKHTKWLVISFATVSLGGNKSINDEKRAWFEKFLKKQEWTAETFTIPNEKVYVIAVNQAR